MFPIFSTNRIDYYILLASFIIWFVPELIVSLTRRKTYEAQIRDRGSRFVISAGMGAGIFLGILSSFSARQYAIPWDRGILFGFGIFLMLSGAAFRWYAIRILGKYFTPIVSIQTGQAVVEKGPYRYIRHPSYTGALISLLGLGLALSNWLSLGLIFLGAAIAYGYRVYVEERVLVEALGQPYRDYMMRTKRFIPFVF